MTQTTNKMKMISELCEEAYQTAVGKGWHDEEREFGTLIALLHTEVMEADDSVDREHENLQEEEKQMLSEELADVLIRLFDLCGYEKIDLEQAVFSKSGVKTLEGVEGKLDVSRSEESEMVTLDKLLLKCHNRLGRVLQAWRKHQPIEERLVDVILQVLETGKALNLTVPKSVYEKMEKNKLRSYKHGGRRI